MKAPWILAAAGALAWAAGALSGAAGTSDEEARRLPAGQGKDAVAKVCLTCHGTAHYRRLRLSHDDWSDRVANMVDQGAQATPEELDAVVDYLTQNFGPQSKVWVNTAPLVELKSVLGLSVEEARAVIAYREKKGDFQEWRDLLKVPEVDGKKIEEGKERMAF